MKLFICLSVVTGIMMLSACEPKKVEKNVWDDQTRALEKAREVEDTLMKKADDLERELENIDVDDIPN